MPNNNQSYLVYYGLTIIIAMGLKILPLPGAANAFNPDWVLLVLIFWSLAIPERIGVLNGWFIGLLIDVLTGRMLGQNALVYSVTCYFSIKFHKRIRQYPTPQQSIFIFVSLLFAQLLIFWIENMQGGNRFHWGFWLQTFIGALCWPVISFLLSFIRIQGRIV